MSLRQDKVHPQGSPSRFGLKVRPQGSPSSIVGVQGSTGFAGWWRGAGVAVVGGGEVARIEYVRFGDDWWRKKVQGLIIDVVGARESLRSWWPIEGALDWCKKNRSRIFGDRRWKQMNEWATGCTEIWRFRRLSDFKACPCLDVVEQQAILEFAGFIVCWIKDLSVVRMLSSNKLCWNLLVSSSVGF